MKTETAANIAKEKMRIPAISTIESRATQTQESIAWSLIAITEVLERTYKWGRA